MSDYSDKLINYAFYIIYLGYERTNTSIRLSKGYIYFTNFCRGILRLVVTYVVFETIHILLFDNFVFSPIFTVITKVAIPFFRFNPTAICFGVFGLTFVVVSCLFCTWISDRLHLSMYLFAKNQFYVKY